MKLLPTSIPEIILIDPQVFTDSRGFFLEIRHEIKFAAAGINQQFVQDNLSHSCRRTLRGLHYQINQPQGKLIRTIRGEIFDVAVDIRQHSPTFGKWIGYILSDENKQALWVPPGFAHGFFVLSEVADVIYSCTDFYAPEHERTIIWNDPELDIKWPRKDNEQPLISPKDAQGSLFKEAELFV
jgi:dTDP-4-dehydrorhamnose 3,5-epimerase